MLRSIARGTHRVLHQSYALDLTPATHPLDPHQCWNQAVHYPYVTTPLLVAENRFDKNQIIAVLGMKGNGSTQEHFIEYFGKQMQHTAIHETLDQNG